MREYLLGTLAATVIWAGAFGISFWTAEWRSDDPSQEGTIDPTRPGVECEHAIRSFFDEMREDLVIREFQVPSERQGGSGLSDEEIRSAFQEWTKPFCP